MKSFTTFKENIKTIESLATRFYVYSYMMPQIKHLVSNFNERPEMHDFFKKDDKEFENKSYEICFIYLVAAFEQFMGDLIHELILRYPLKLPVSFKRRMQNKFIKEKLVFQTESDLVNCIIDYYSIEKSFTIEIWKKTLMNEFRINIFPEDKQEAMIYCMSLFRNSILHAGGLRNSSFIINSTRIFPQLKDEVEWGFERDKVKVTENLKTHFKNALSYYKRLIETAEKDCLSIDKL